MTDRSNSSTHAASRTLDDLYEGENERETMFRTVNNITKHAIVDGLISIIPTTETMRKVVASGYVTSTGLSVD